jgi:dGTPase
MMNNYAIRDRQALENIEEKVLSPFAAKSAEGAKTRLVDEPEHAYRTAFQRDRDRIIHSRAFRRLKHKRQVFLTSYGDHYRTRLTHTLEVSQLSRTMARAMGLNEDLTEAIGLAHDLGHTPFGHIGEVVLDDILKGDDNLDGVLPFGDVGGFKHNYQSVRIVDRNETKYRFEGLNLTAPVREGILKHTRLRRGHINFPDFEMEGLFYELDHATTLEGQIVALCDEIAQRTHDLEDGIRAKYVTLAHVRQLELIRIVEKEHQIHTKNDDDFLYRNLLIRQLVHFLVTNVLEETLRNMQQFHRLVQRHNFFDTRLVWFSPAIDPLQDELDRFIMREIIAKAAEKRSDDRAKSTIRRLFGYFYQYPNLLPIYRLFKCANDEERSLIYGGSFEQKYHIKSRLDENPLFARAICDHVAGMTDSFAEQAIDRLSKMSKVDLQQKRADQQDLGL